MTGIQSLEFGVEVKAANNVIADHDHRLKVNRRESASDIQLMWVRANVCPVHWNFSVFCLNSV